jgi:hypothetical protein
MLQLQELKSQLYGEVIIGDAENYLAAIINLQQIQVKQSRQNTLPIASKVVQGFQN